MTFFLHLQSTRRYGVARLRPALLPTVRSTPASGKNLRVRLFFFQRLIAMAGTEGGNEEAKVRENR